MKEIKTNKIPKAVGPYSQAIKVGNLVFCSGQIGLDPKANTLLSGGIKAETRQTLENLSHLLEASGLSFGNVVRVDIFLTDINDFTKVNEIYGEYFTQNPKPARQTVAVKNLPKGALIEISCIAYLQN